MDNPGQSKEHSQHVPELYPPQKMVLSDFFILAAHIRLCEARFVRE